MNFKKQILICIIFSINWICAFSQNAKSQNDSLKIVVQNIEDQTTQQIQIIDSLKFELNKFEFNKLKIDSLKAENERLKIIRDKYCEELNFDLIDSVDVFNIKSGFYFRTLPQENDLEKFYNEIEWIYISESHEVKEFITANFEYCMYEMHFDGKPKNIYRQIKKKQEKFDSLYLICNQGQKTSPSESINGEFIVLSRKLNSICISDILIFQSKGIVRKKRTEKDIVTYQYEFVGK